MSSNVLNGMTGICRHMESPRIRKWWRCQGLEQQWKRQVSGVQPAPVKVRINHGEYGSPGWVGQQPLAMIMRLYLKRFWTSVWCFPHGLPKWCFTVWALFSPMFCPKQNNKKKGRRHGVGLLGVKQPKKVGWKQHPKKQFNHWIQMEVFRPFQQTSVKSRKSNQKTGTYFITKVLWTPKKNPKNLVLLDSRLGVFVVISDEAGGIADLADVWRWGEDETGLWKVGQKWLEHVRNGWEKWVEKNWRHIYSYVPFLVWKMNHCTLQTCTVFCWDHSSFSNALCHYVTWLWCGLLAVGISATQDCIWKLWGTTQMGSLMQFVRS